jgi:hypothetical protein
LSQVIYVSFFFFSDSNEREITHLEVKDIPEDVLDGLRGCPQFVELVGLPNDEAYSTRSHFQDIHINRRYSTSKGPVRPQEIVIPWSEVPTPLKVSLAAFLDCNTRSLASISFMVFQQADGIHSHCDEGWVGESFWGFSVAFKAEPSSFESYRLVFTRNKTVVGEHVVRSNTAYYCSGKNRHYFKHGVAPSKSVGRRFFMRVGLQF